MPHVSDRCSPVEGMPGARGAACSSDRWIAALGLPAPEFGRLRELELSEVDEGGGKAERGRS